MGGGGGMMERARRQLGVRLKVKGLWVEAEARRLIGMSLCRNGICRGRQTARGGVHFTGETEWQVYLLWWCVCRRRGEMVRWP